jgi:hypothetical protein
LLSTGLYSVRSEPREDRGHGQLQRAYWGGVDLRPEEGTHSQLSQGRQVRNTGNELLCVIFLLQVLEAQL